MQTCAIDELIPQALASAATHSADKKLAIMGRINQLSQKDVPDPSKKELIKLCEDLYVEILTLKGVTDNTVKASKVLLAQIFSKLSSAKEGGAELVQLVEARKKSVFASIEAISKNIEDLTAALKSLEKNHNIESESEAPPEFLCIISHEVMEDPVIAEDKQCYDRKNIEEWFKDNTISPYNRQPIGKTLIIDTNKKDQIASWKQKKKGPESFHTEKNFPIKLEEKVTKSV